MPIDMHAYEECGEACVDRFRGMFAFAIWDAGRERLFLAHDRFGKKPLFLARRGDDLLFASEIKALLAFPGIPVEVDRQAVWDYLAYRYTPGPATLFSGIEKLAPGSYAVWSKGSLTQSRYYLPPDWQAQSDTGMSLKDPPHDPIDAFLASLDELVRIRMVSDVPFGAYLSGGVDSSAVVGLMTRHSGLPVKTFSVGFAQRGYSELDHARVVSQQFGTQHHELVVSERDLMDALPALVRFRDAPVSEPSDIPIFLLSKEARRRVKMVLTGEGSDEFLGGYPKHVYERYVGRYQALPRMLRESLLEPLVMSLPYRFRRAKTAIVNMNLARATDRFPRWFGALSPKERDALIAFQPPDGGSYARSNNGEQFATDTGNSALRRILYFDQMSWLPDNLLERGDRMTMAASIEARMPFMDQELAAFVSSLPDCYRVRGFKTKWILRQAMTRLLPARILERPKVGFRVPVNEWFRGAMRDFLYDHLTGPDSRTRGYYRDAALHKLMAEHVNGHQNYEKLLWSLLNLELWHREYGARA